MRSPATLILTILLLLSLCACSSQPPESPETTPETQTVLTQDPNWGKYLCTSVTMNGMDLGPDGQWLELSGQGKALVFLGGEPEEATWTLTGTAFTLTMGGQTSATGTLADGTLTVNLLGMDCIFVKEGTSPSAAPEFTPSMGTFSCQGLYSVTYPLDLFQAPGDGLTDLVSPTGTKVWFTKLDTRADANQWRSDFQTKLAGSTVLQSQQLDLTAGEYTAEAVIYQEADGWHAAVLVDFGRNRGSEGRSMAAACIYLNGPTQEDVWNDQIQRMVSSLKLGQ